MDRRIITVYNFKRYEDASLEYAGIKMHSDDEDVGLFSTVISRDDYEQMAKQESSSMELPFTAPAPETKPSKVAPFKPKKESAVPKTEVQPKRPIIVEKNIIKAAEPIPTYGEKEALEIPDIHVGNKVYHKKFGEGTIVAIKDDKFTVRFKEGTKTLATQTVFKNGMVSVIGGG